MESIKIDILNPKAKKLIQDLADQKLIRTRESKESGRDFFQIVKKLRAKTKKPPSEYNIAKEVEAV